jgi:hypothetical protein
MEEVRILDLPSSTAMNPISLSCGTPATALRRFLIVVVTIVMAGCAAPHRTPEPAAPPIQIAESTWRLVDSDIGAASLAAAGPAKGLAHRQMEHWRELVSQRTEADFIPWFSSYWTQQWLATKVAWYQFSPGDVSTRLASYLQEQYRDRVLVPVAREVDPEAVRARVTEVYVRHFRDELRLIPARHAVPLAQFQRRLETIPVIELAPPPAHNASLYQIAYAEKIDRLPAYIALLHQAHQGPGGAATTREERISPVAKRVSRQLLDRLAISGGSSAASAIVGGIAGTIISLGSAAFGMVLHESNRAETEAQLRESLDAALSDAWQSLMDAPITGVMSGINYLSDQIEKCCPQTYAQPVELEQAPQEIPLPESDLPSDEINEVELPNDGDELGQSIEDLPGDDDSPGN